MKRIILTVLCILTIVALKAQDFTQHLADARSSYSAKKLEDARFAMQQMLQELDIMAGKEIMKMLPVKLESLNLNPSNDNVGGASGFAGVIIHRDYGSNGKMASIDIIGNSPLMSSVNALLSLPFIAATANQKVIKLQGYKALLQKTTDTETNQVTYEVQVPINSSLLTLKSEKATEEEMMKYAASLPVAELAKTLQ